MYSKTSLVCTAFLSVVLPGEVIAALMVVLVVVAGKVVVVSTGDVMFSSAVTLSEAVSAVVYLQGKNKIINQQGYVTETSKS